MKIALYLAFFLYVAAWEQLRMILTSPRCVESVKRSTDLADGPLAWESNLKENWLNKKIFCVGPSTANKFLLDFGPCQNIIVSNDGNSQSLAKSIVEEDSKQRIGLPLLYPCGVLKMDTIGLCLTEAKIAFKTVTVYNTIQNPKLEELLLETTSKDDKGKRVYVFFSPSGVGFVLPHLTDITSSHIVAIGPTTASALKKSAFIGNKIIHQCASPTPESLLDVVKKIRDSKSLLN